VEDEDSDELEDDGSASRSEESDPAEEVATARANRSTGRALNQIAALEAWAAATSSRGDSMNAQDRPVQSRTPVNRTWRMSNRRSLHHHEALPARVTAAILFPLDTAAELFQRVCLWV
jgi:hypothetical protein